MKKGKKCPKCNELNVPGAFQCGQCGENLEKVKAEEHEGEYFEYKVEKSNNSNEPCNKKEDNTDFPERGGAILVLRIFAWIDLVAGIVGAIIIWANFSSVEVPIFAGSTVTRDHVNPIGISLGIVVLAQGIFFHMLFIVVAGAAEDVAAIRKKGES